MKANHLEICLRQLPQVILETFYTEVIYNMITPAIVSDLQALDLNKHAIELGQITENSELSTYCNQIMLNLSDLLEGRDNPKFVHSLNLKTLQLDQKLLSQIIYRLSHLTNLLFTIERDIKNAVMLGNISRALGYQQEDDVVYILLPSLKVICKSNNIDWDTMINNNP